MAPWMVTRAVESLLFAISEEHPPDLSRRAPRACGVGHHACAATALARPSERSHFVDSWSIFSQLRAQHAQSESELPAR
jgi:hypothetical protein